MTKQIKSLEEFMVSADEPDTIDGYKILQQDPFILEAPSGTQLIVTTLQDGYNVSILQNEKLIGIKIPFNVYNEIKK